MIKEMALVEVKVVGADAKYNRKRIVRYKWHDRNNAFIHP